VPFCLEKSSLNWRGCGISFEPARRSPLVTGLDAGQDGRRLVWMGLKANLNDDFDLQCRQGPHGVGDLLRRR